MRRNSALLILALFSANLQAAVQLLPDDKVDTVREVGTINQNFIELQQDKLDAQKALPTLAKAWATFSGSGAVVVLDSYNVTSVSYTGAGNYLITLTTNFRTATYPVLVSSRRSAGANGFCRPGTQTAGTVQIQTYDTAAVATDHELVNVVIFGDQ